MKVAVRLKKPVGSLTNMLTISRLLAPCQPKLSEERYVSVSPTQ